MEGVDFHIGDKVCFTGELRSKITYKDAEWYFRFKHGVGVGAHGIRSW